MPEEKLVLTLDARQLSLASRTVNRDLDGIAKGSTTAGTSLEKLQRIFITLGGAAVLGVTIRQFAIFEKGLIGVGKTADLSGSALDKLGAQITDIGREVPVATAQLLGIAQAAGQLGVKGADNITRFTKTVAQLGLASDLAGEEAATSLARILTVTGTAIRDVDRLGSVIVRLGNNFAATESEIAAVATRVAQSTAAFEVSAAEVAGLGAALKSVGIEAEAGGTGVQKAFIAIQDAITEGGAQFVRLQEITRQTGDALRENFDRAPTEIFEKFVQGLARIRQEAGPAGVLGTLNELGLSGVRSQTVLAALAKTSDNLSRALRLANDEFEVNNALTKEAITASTTFTAQLQLVANRLNAAAVTVGRRLAPAILEATDQLVEFINSAEGLGQIESVAIAIGNAFKFVADNLGLITLAAAAFVGVKLGAALGGVVGALFGPGGAAIGAAAGGAIGGFSALAGAISLAGQASVQAGKDLSGLNAELKFAVSIEKELTVVQGERLQNNLLILTGERKLAELRLQQESDKLAELVAIQAGPSIDVRKPGISGLVEDQTKVVGDAVRAFNRLSRAIAPQAKAIEAYKNQVKAATEPQKEFGEAIGKSAAEIGRQENALNAFQGRLAQARSVFQSTRTPLERYNSEIERLTKLYIDGLISQETFTRAVRDSKEALETATATVETSTDKLKSFKDQADPTAKAFENAATNIQRAFSDAFVDIFDSGLDSFKNLTDAIGDVFKRLLAELATLAIARPIIIPLVTSVAGGLGLGPGQVAGVLQNFGLTGGTSGAGGLGLPIFGNPFSGLSSGINSFGASIGFAPGLTTSIGSGGSLIAGPPVISSLPGGGLTGALGTTTTLSSALGFAGLGALGGGILGPLLGLDSTGSSLGGGAGALIGSLGGPLGALGGGILGTVLGGSLLGGLFGKENSSETIQALTSQGTGGFSSAFEKGPFGFIGAGGNTRGTATSLDQDIANLLLRFDESIATILTARQIRLVSTALQATEAVTVTGKTIDNELFDIIKDRSLTVLGGAFPDLFGGDPFSDISRSQENVERLQERAAEALSFGTRFQDITGRAAASQGGPRGLQLFDIQRAANDRADERLEDIRGFLGDAERFLLNLGPAPAQGDFQNVTGTEVVGGGGRGRRGRDAIGRGRTGNRFLTQDILTPDVAGFEAALAEFNRAATAGNANLREAQAAVKTLAKSFLGLGPDGPAPLSGAALAVRTFRIELEAMQPVLEEAGFTTAQASSLIRQASAQNIPGLISASRSEFDPFAQQLQGAVANIDSFQLGLNTGPLSALSPRAQLDAARRNFLDVRRSALGGDTEAINQITGAGQLFLSEARDFGASGPVFQQAFRQVNSTLDAVRSDLLDVQADFNRELIRTFGAESEATRETLRDLLGRVVDELVEVRRELRAIEEAAA